MRFGFFDNARVLDIGEIFTVGTVHAYQMPIQRSFWYCFLRLECSHGQLFTLEFPLGRRRKPRQC